MKKILLVMSLLVVLSFVAGCALFGPTLSTEENKFIGTWSTTNVSWYEKFTFNSTKSVDTYLLPTSSTVWLTYDFSVPTTGTLLFKSSGTASYTYTYTFLSTTSLSMVMITNSVGATGDTDALIFTKQ